MARELDRAVARLAERHHGYFRLDRAYDSDAHHLAPDEIAHDHHQRQRLQGLGYGVVVARSGDVRAGGHAFIDALATTLQFS